MLLPPALLQNPAAAAAAAAAVLLVAVGIVMIPSPAKKLYKEQEETITLEGARKMLYGFVWMYCIVQGFNML